MTDNTKHGAVKTGPYRTAFPYILALLVFLSSPGLVAAAGPAMLGEILAKTEANYQNIHAFTALFHQKTTSAAAGTMGSAEASGRLFYERPRQMRWEYEKPEDQVFVANNQFAWLYVRAENQITLFDADKLFSSPLARTFFDGALGLKNHFDVTLESSRSTRNLGCFEARPKAGRPKLPTHLSLDRPAELQDFPHREP